MSGARPPWQVKATDEQGDDYKAGGLWPTASKEVFKGSIDLEGNGDKIRLPIFADRPNEKPAKPAERKPAPRMDRFLTFEAFPTSLNATIHRNGARDIRKLTQLPRIGYRIDPQVFGPRAKVLH